MNKKTLIIGGSILGLLVVGYFVFRKKDDVENPETGDEAKDDVVDNTSTSTDKPKIDKPKKDDVSNEKINPKIDYISKNGLGNNAQKTYLSKAPSEYVNSWYNAIKSRKESSNKKGTTFIHNGSVYDSYYGNKKMDKNPIGKLAKSNKDGNIYKNAEIGGFYSKIATSKGQELGVVKGYKFNSKDKNLWLYIPDTNVTLSLTKGVDFINEYKWIPFKDVSITTLKK